MADIIKKGYKKLNLMNFFTVGADEVRSWTVREGSKAPQAAGVIHSDFEKGFIRAEVMKYDELAKHGSEGAMKKKGLYHSHGRDYTVQDGDVVLFKLNSK